MEQQESHNKPNQASRTHDLAYRRNAVIFAKKAYKSRKEAYEIMRHNYEQKIAIVSARAQTALHDRIIEELRSSCAIESALAQVQLDVLRERLAKMKRKLARAKEEVQQK